MREVYNTPRSNFIVLRRVIYQCQNLERVGLLLSVGFLDEEAHWESWLRRLLRGKEAMAW